MPEAAQATIAAAAITAAAQAHDEVLALRAKLGMTREELRAEIAPPLSQDAGKDELAALRLALAEAIEIRFANLPVDVRDVMEQLMETRQQLQQARERADDAKRAYAAIRSSTSWRVTAPLRMLVDVVRRLRGRPAG